MPKISHEILATMVGTTRSRISYFMNRFKDQGFIDYGKGMVVRPSQLVSGDKRVLARILKLECENPK